MARGLRRPGRRARGGARASGRGSTSSTTRAWVGSASATPTRCSRWSIGWRPTIASTSPALWTHFATADEPDSEFFDEQLERFGPLAERVRAQHPGVLVHAANSAATLRDPASHFDMARCGIAIYGLDPFHVRPRSRGASSPRSSCAPTSPTSSASRPGASAGYGQRWRAPADTWVGVLPIGYGDGVRRGLTNNAEVLVGGARYPLVGTVSMDNVTVDLGPELGGRARRRRRC